MIVKFINKTESLESIDEREMLSKPEIGESIVLDGETFMIENISHDFEKGKQVILAFIVKTKQLLKG